MTWNPTLSQSPRGQILPQEQTRSAGGEMPADIIRSAEDTLDLMLCECTESCGGTEGLRQDAISKIAAAILAERVARNEGFKIAISYLEETLGFASLSPVALENIETALHLLTVEG